MMSAKSPASTGTLAERSTVLGSAARSGACMRCPTLRCRPHRRVNGPQSRSGEFGGGCSRARRLGLAPCRMSSRPSSAPEPLELSGDDLKKMGQLPSVAVMDLDHTLFRCHLDTDSYGPPYNRIDDHSVQDSRGNVIRLYPEARAICHALHDAGVELAVASRSPVKSWYKQVLDVLDLSPVVGAMYIGGGSNFGTPGSKLGHFKMIRDATGVGFQGMVLLDDEFGNIETMELHGVTAGYVPRHGATFEALQEVIVRWQERQR